jgi:hypothetical protein
MVASFGVFPVSVAIGGVVVRDFGPALFFPLAAGVMALAIGTGLAQHAWREFGATASSRTADRRDEPVEEELII